MKKSVLIVFLSIMGCLSAQDIIVKKDGNVIKAKVVEITENSVQYKNFSNPEGPTYSITIENIFSLTYENGEKESFSNAAPSTTNSTTTEEIENRFSRTVLESQIADLESRAKTIDVVGEIITISASLGALATWVILSDGDDSFGNIALGTGVFIGVMFAGFYITNAIAKPSREQARALRNQLSDSCSLQPALLHYKGNENYTLGVNLSYRF